MSALLVSFSGVLGGAERVLLDWCSDSPGGFVLACPPGPLVAAAREAGLVAVELSERPLPLGGRAAAALADLIGFGRDVRRLADELGAESVVAWGMRPALALAAGAGQREAVHVAVDLAPRRWLRPLLCVAARRFDLVIAHSEAIADDLDPRRRLGARLQVSRPGVTPPPDAETAAGQGIAVLGALVAWKRPELALEIHRQVRRQVPAATLRFIGGAPAGLDAAVLGPLPPGVSVSGWLPDPSAELTACAVALHCADREPFGMAVLEAIAAGRPVVAPAGGGPQEILDGECGVLYPPGDSTRAAEAVAALLVDPERAVAMGQAGRVRAERLFSASAARRRWLETGLGAPAGRPEAGAEISVITVTHNSATHLRRLLVSLHRHLPAAEVVVVDCASTDSSVAVAEAAGAVVVALADNAGFASGCNRGLAQATRAVTLLLNPDVELVDGSLGSLAREAQTHPERLLAPLVLRGDGRRQDSVHPAPISAAALALALVPATVLPGSWAIRLCPWRAGTPRRVGWAVGCALLGATATWRELGGLDERFWMYGEDLELGLRAARHGVQTWFWPSGRVIHHGAHAAAASFGGEPVERLAGERRRAVRYGVGPRAVQIDDLLQAVTFATRIAARALIGRPAGREQAQLRALLFARGQGAI